MTNEMLINLFLESNFSHLHLVHSVVTYPVLSTILKIRYISKHHTPITPVDTDNDITNNIIELTDGNINNNNEEGKVTPPDSWEDIYNSSEEDNPQIIGNSSFNLILYFIYLRYLLYYLMYIYIYIYIKEEINLYQFIIIIIFLVKSSL